MKTFIYSGGEHHVEEDGPYPAILHRIQSSDDLIKLLLRREIADRNWGGLTSKLIIPYFPYARQDRVTSRDTAFSLKVIAKLINDLDFHEVVSCDVHSDVTPALVDRMRVVTQLEIIKQFSGLVEWIGDIRPFIVAPDAGAVKKAQSIATHFKLPFVAARKYRDCETGEISGTHVDGAVNDVPCLIVDDICDGGRTFIELAKALRQNGAKYVALYVTHGIFSKGYDVFNGLIDRIYTTDCFIPKSLPLPDQVPLFVHKLPFMEL
jgi:ribose-phosphate pyrophosphokinase